MSPDSTGADSLFSCEPVHYTPAMSDSPQVGSAGALRAALWL